MDLGVVFKFSLYGLTALVGAILGAAEGEGTTQGSGSLVLPFLSLPVVICGYFVSERRRKDHGAVGLSSGWANVLGIVALIATGYEFSGQNREAKLLAGTHLLLYATWIVMFQRKTVRLYWFSMALGILQLAVASVLTSKGWFGFCALIYTFGAVWTLSIFSLWRAEQQFAEEERRRVIVPLRHQNGGRMATVPRLATKSEVRGSVQHEGGTQWLTARFVTGVLLTTCSALLVSAGFFAFIPRVWAGPTVSFSDDNSPLAGLNRRMASGAAVRLGQLGPILESSERVFEIKIMRIPSKKVITAQEYAQELGSAEPLFRNAVLTTYEKGLWRMDSLENFLGKPFGIDSIHPDVKQIIRLDPNAPSILYCLGQPLWIVSNSQPIGELDESSGVAFFAERKRDNVVFEYSVYTSRPQNSPRHYKFEISPRAKVAYQKTKYHKTNVWLPSNLERLKELTHEIIQRETARQQRFEDRQTPRKLTRLEIATALEDFLLDPKQFSYTLEQSIQDPKIDPVEDFLFNRKAGHCEYFATALTLMLRAANIPARMVCGFKGGESSAQKKEWLEVQQRFSHVWVEAWVDNADDGWTTFDPTPADARSQSVASIGAKKPSLWSDMQLTFSGLWSENILNMSLDRQEASIYKPMRNLGFSLLTFVQQLFTSPRAALLTILKLIKNRENWFSLGGGLFAAAFLLCAMGMFWLCRWVLSGFFRWWSIRSGQKNHNQNRIIEFYERFVGLMKVHGLVRSPTQTQYEFAEFVANAYSPELSVNGLTDIPKRISQLFYGVRFGDENLSDDEVNQIESLLVDLERGLSNHSTRKEPIGLVSGRQAK